MRKLETIACWGLLILATLMGVTSCATNQRIARSTGPDDFDQSKLDELLGQLVIEKTNLHSLLVERKGRLEVELYQNGWNTSMSDGGGVFSFWSEMGPDTIHDVRSTTKSVVALLAGTVLARHPEYSVHSKIRDFPELAQRTPEWGQRLELGHFLRMSSGLSWKEWGQSFLTSDETALGWVADPLKYALDRPLVSEPGTEFNYSGGSTFIAARMVELMEGRSIEEIARTDLFIPLGITEWRWGKGTNGSDLPHAGLGLRSRDMLKLGKLMLDKGRWKGQQVIPEAWVEEVTAPRHRVGTKMFDLDENGTNYGYFWWNGTIAWLGADVTWYSTVGNGGQKIFVVPQRSLVVVMTAGDYGSPDIQVWETNFLKRLLKTLRN